MPIERWTKRTASDRLLWDKLDDIAKATILGTPTMQETSLSERHVNLNEIRAYDFLQANLHETTQETADNDDKDYHEAQENTDAQEDSTLLVNNTTR
jgi:hypothetical protein